MSVIMYYKSRDRQAKARAEYLIESGYEFTLKKGWHGRNDRATQPNQKDHTHLLLRNNEMCVVNRDGTPSHNSDLSRAPKWVFKALRKKGFLNEARVSEALGMPAEIIAEAIEHLANRTLFRGLIRLMRESRDKKAPAAKPRRRHTTFKEFLAGVGREKSSPK